jgi:hypothetical protein
VPGGEVGSGVGVPGGEVGSGVGDVLVVPQAPNSGQPRKPSAWFTSLELI